MLADPGLVAQHNVEYTAKVTILELVQCSLAPFCLPVPAFQLLPNCVALSELKLF